MKHDELAMDYAACRICALECGDDRRASSRGACRAGVAPRVFCEVVEYGEEAGLVPAYAVSLSGCNFRCGFCITGEQSWNARAGVALDVEALAGRIAEAYDAGRIAAAIVLGGEPTIYLPHLLALVDALRDRAPGLTLALKTNLFTGPAATDAAGRAFDVIVADYKFGDGCGRPLAGVESYGHVVRSNLRRVAGTDARLVVRHLVMPGHLDCCTAPIVDWMAAALPDVELSLRDHFVPAFRAFGDARLGRTTSRVEAGRLAELAARHPKGAVA